MLNEENIRFCLRNKLKSYSKDNEYWKGYVEALADILEIDLIQI